MKYWWELYLANCSKIGQKCNWRILLWRFNGSSISYSCGNQLLFQVHFNSKPWRNVEQHKWPRSQLHIYLSELSLSLSIRCTSRAFSWWLLVPLNASHLCSLFGARFQTGKGTTDETTSLFWRFFLTQHRHSARERVTMTSSSINFGGFYIGECPLIRQFVKVNSSPIFHLIRYAQLLYSLP